MSRPQVSPEILNPATAPPRRWRIDLSSALALAPSIIALIVSATIAWFAQSSEVRAHTAAITEARRQIIELQQAQHAAAIEAARLQGDYAAVIKGIDQRLALMQSQLDRIEERARAN